MVKEDLKKGIVRTGEHFVGKMNGYAVMEGSEVEIGNALQRYSPWVHL
jgi:hypothetical protein